MLVEHGGEHLTSVEVSREWIWQVHIYDTKLLVFFPLFFFSPRNNEDERIIFLLFI